MQRAASLSLFIAAMAGPLVQAAPTTPDTVDSPQLAEHEVRMLPDRLRATESDSGSQTIDLLIDMQQRSAGVQFNERQRTAGSGDIKPRPMPAAAAPATLAAVLPGTEIEAPPTPPSGLFGSGATPMAQPARAATVEPRNGLHMDAAPARRPATSSNGEPLPRWMLLPREAIQYVRENRWLVLSSVAGGLLLIWGVSSMFARAAAHAGRVSVLQADRALSARRWGSTRQDALPARRRSRRRPG